MILLETRETNLIGTYLFRVQIYLQSLGKDLDSAIYVEELNTKMSRDEIFQVLVIDPMMGAIEVDWRDFFPYLRWVPNKSMEMKIQQMSKRRHAVMKALIGEQKKRIASGEVKVYNTTPFKYHLLHSSFINNCFSLKSFSDLAPFKQVLDSFVDFLLSESNTFTETELSMLIWEATIETSDTTLVTAEWAMYELAKNKNCQVFFSTNCPYMSVSFY